MWMALAQCVTSGEGKSSFFCPISNLVADRTRAILASLFSLFDFERYGDEDYGAEKSGFVEHAQRPAGGKLEKSFMNFQQQHPNYDGGKAAKGMCSRLQAFKSTRYVLSHMSTCP